YNLDNRPSNKLMANCKSISSFIRILKYGIKIGNKQHLVVPNIVNYRLCENCGGLNHRKNNCVKEKRCLKCAESGHETKECKLKRIKCLNCSGLHKCYNDDCTKYAEKKFLINSYCLEILIGE
ncbi:unnamed protein product, partial [Brachionus calyciflorus]